MSHVMQNERRRGSAYRLARSTSGSKFRRKPNNSGDSQDDLDYDDHNSWQQSHTGPPQPPSQSSRRNVQTYDDNVNTSKMKVPPPPPKTSKRHSVKGSGSNTSGDVDGPTRRESSPVNNSNFEIPHSPTTKAKRTNDSIGGGLKWQHIPPPPRSPGVSMRNSSSSQNYHQSLENSNNSSSLNFSLGSSFEGDWNVSERSLNHSGAQNPPPPPPPRRRPQNKANSSSSNHYPGHGASTSSASTNSHLHSSRNSDSFHRSMEDFESSEDDHNRYSDSFYSSSESQIRDFSQKSETGVRRSSGSNNHVNPNKNFGFSRKASLPAKLPSTESYSNKSSRFSDIDVTLDGRSSYYSTSSSRLHPRTMHEARIYSERESGGEIDRKSDDGNDYNISEESSDESPDSESEQSHPVEDDFNQQCFEEVGECDVSIEDIRHVYAAMKSNSNRSNRSNHSNQSNRSNRSNRSHRSNRSNRSLRNDREHGAAGLGAAAVTAAAVGLGVGVGSEGGNKDYRTRGSRDRIEALNASDEEVEENKTQLARLVDSLLCIFPKVEPLPWKTFFALSAWCCVPPAGYIAFFTQMGLGEQLFYTLSERFGDYAYGLALALAGYAFILYMLDANEWDSKLGSLVLDFSVISVVTGIVLLVLLIADMYPYGMVCLFALFNPLWLLAVKIVFYSSVDTRVYVSWLSGPLFLVSVAAALAWTIWVFFDVDNQWNTVARIEAAERSSCEPNYEVYPECRSKVGSEDTCFYVEEQRGTQMIIFPEGCSQSCTSVYSECLNGFILWIGPVLVSMTMFFLSFFCTFFRTEGAKEKDVLNFGKVWLFILVAIWVTSSLAGTAAGVTASLAALTLASFVASAVFLTVSFNSEERYQNAAAVFERIRSKYGKHLDIARGLFVVTCAPIVLIYFALSIMNQCVRSTGVFPCSKPPSDEETEPFARDIFTSKTRQQINVMKTWDRAKVYTYAIYWGIAFMVLQVIVAKITVVFLSWLIEETSNLGLGFVTIIMVITGVIMFLLPPVPGVPVYLTLGIVLPAQGHNIMGWVGSIAYSVGVGLALKLFSSAIQQKMIGEQLSNFVKVRQFIGINSTLMKAMRLVLREDGLSVPKVAILIGGPDWPTSVLCGIMRLSVIQIMIGTIPIVFLIIPTCATGSLLYMASLETESGNPEFPWAGTVSAITASLTAIVQFGSMVVAAYYLEQTADKRSEELESIEVDIEVKEADDRAEHLRKCYLDVTEWSRMPTGAKMLVRTSLACIIVSSYMVQIFASRCFVPHSLTDTIDGNLEGNATNLFLPLGWVAMILFLVSCVFLYIFQVWGKKQAKILASSTNVQVSSSNQGLQRRQSNGEISQFSSGHLSSTNSENEGSSYRSSERRRSSHANF